MELLETARTLDGFGWVLVPNRDKVPVVKGWTNFTKQNGYRITRSQIENGRANNIGILAGEESGLVAVDIDDFDSWLEIAEKEIMPETFTVITGKGGVHYYFSYEGKVVNLHTGVIKNRKGKRIGDFRTDGGQIMAPGSTNTETGRKYLVYDDGQQSGYRPLKKKGDPVPILAEMPDWLYELLKANQR